MTINRYEQVPAHVAQGIIQAHKAEVAAAG
jgi:hypothetical protein